MPQHQGRVEQLNLALRLVVPPSPYHPKLFFWIKRALQPASHLHI